MSLTVGSQIRLSYKVYSNGVLTDPATATVAITLPDRITVVNANPTLPSTVPGIVTYDYTTTQPGPHRFIFTTTNPVTVDTGTFNVDPASSIALFSLSDAKRFLNEPLVDTTNDAEIEDMVNVVTEIVESKVGPVVPKTYSEKVQSGQSLPLRHGPIISITSITPWMLGVGAETVSPSQVTINNEGWCLDRNIGFWRGPYNVTYLAGRTSVSYSILMGGKDILDHLWETQRGSSLVGPGAPRDDEAFSVFGRTYTVPRAVLEMLHPQAIGPQIG